MVKTSANQPLQIRLTEPVIFLRGPSTGLDFRGRPQVVRQDAQPAMVRGLLTLRLTKPTRIREIRIKLEGKSRTEWPEGIGPRRLDTFEEQELIKMTTTFFSSEESHSRSRSARRARSIGPGIAAEQWDLDDDLLEDDEDLANVPLDGEDSEWMGITRGRDRRVSPTGVMRSASALPGTHDGTSWHRDGFSRRPSFDNSGDDGPRRPSQRLGMAGLSLRERGPSPAYFPDAEHDPAAQYSRRSSLRQSAPRQSAPRHESALSPIVSAAPSRATSDRDDSTETERERRQASAAMRARMSDDAVPEMSETGTPVEVDDGPTTAEAGPSMLPRSILDIQPQRSSSGVHFSSPPTMDEVPFLDDDADEPASHTAQTGARQRRAASVRTMESGFSHHSASSGSSHSGEAGSGGIEHRGEYHPSLAAIQTSSTHSTPYNNSPAGSVGPSLEDLRTPVQPNASGPFSVNYQDYQVNGSAAPQTSSSLAPPARRSSITSPFSTTPTSAMPSSSQTASPSRSSAATQSPLRPGPPRVVSNTSTRSASTSNASLHGNNLQHPDLDRQSSHDSTATASDSRGRRHSKFGSIGAALRGLSEDVRRVASKSRSRQPSSRTASFADPMPDGAAARVASISAVPPRLREGSVEPSFVAPGGGRGGAGARSRSTERTESPTGKGEGRSDRARGRNKMSKLLTGAFGGGNTGSTEDDDDMRNWKEFRRGTYNYPISFPVPVTSPPTVHADFGSVAYRLKATVVRAGTLMPNLVEEVEVMMIATPQEDDLEETENVLVERQWEEQMRYQIGLSGKAFPIGGIIPFSMRLMPLVKVKLYRLSVTLEQKTDYYAQGRRVARHETPRKFPLLMIKNPDNKDLRSDPLLPIISADPNAGRDSLLAPLAKQAALSNPLELEVNPSLLAGEIDEDALYANLLQPLGPWHLESTLVVPDCASKIRFTTKHDKTNMAVGHMLKVIMRVERGDGDAVDAKGRKKQFDIIIETPIKVLDCRVNPQWNSLPTYTSFNANPGLPVGICSVHAKSSSVPAPEVRPDPPRGRRASHATVREDSPHSPAREDTLLERNIQYDRLMSGQETESGEHPPTYGEALNQKARSASRSASRPRLRAGERDGSDSRSRSRAGRGRNPMRD